MSAELTRKQIEAAKHVVDDSLTDTQIAESVGVSQRTLERWKKIPAFQAFVSEQREAYRNAVLSEGIADRRNRIRAMNERWEGLQQVIDARGRRYMQLRAEGDESIPQEAETGLVVREGMFVKVLEPTREAAFRALRIEEIDEGDFIPTKQSQIVYKYAVDTGMMAEMRALEKQAAEDLGQWKEQVEHSGGVTIVREYPEGL